MIQENGENVRQKCKILFPCLASAIGVVAFVAGGFTVNAESVEPQAPDPTKEMSDRIPETAPTSSWNTPLFTGNPGNMGSPYVPLDSWIYPAFDRLIALGYVRSAIVGQRPWTRLECRRLLNEATGLLSEGAEGDEEALAIHDALAQEFSHESALLDGQHQRLLSTQCPPARREQNLPLAWLALRGLKR
jgi:hypothetical protein